MEVSFARRALWVIWPAFLVAAAAETVFFAVFDPFDLHFFGTPLELSREAMYTLGFFGFWGVGIVSSALTAFLERSPSDVNRPTRESPDRSEGTRCGN